MKAQDSSCNKALRAFACFWLLLAGHSAFAVTQCYQWTASKASSGVSPPYSDPQKALDWLAATCNASQSAMYNCAGGIGCAAANLENGTCSFVLPVTISAPYLTPTGFPFYAFDWTLSWNQAPFPTSTHTFSGRSFVPVGAQGGCQFFTVNEPPGRSEPASCPVSGEHPVLEQADPVAPAAGTVIVTEGDCKPSLTGASTKYARFYDSSESAATNLGPGWRGSYSRRVRSSTAPAPDHLYATGNPNYSSKFPEPDQACTGGFAQLQPSVPAWAGAVAQYVGGVCQITKNGVVIGILPIFSTGGVPAPFPTPIVYTVIRDDGHTIRFWKQNGVMRTTAGVALRFQATAGGYTLIDGDDQIEQYDSAGVLLSLASRAGVVQTMSYTAGRLSGVDDSFGHTLTFGYDAQNRLISVVRQ